jgi:hypothetical protein
LPAAKRLVPSTLAAWRNKMMPVDSKKKLMMVGWLLCALIVGGLLYAAFVSYSPAASKPQQEYQEYIGQVTLYDKKNNDGSYTKVVCTIPFVTSTINFQDNSLGCVNDETYAFILQKVDSATYFTFTDEPDCSDKGGFYYRFKTIKHPTDMEKPMEIEAAGRIPVGSVATPGVLVIASETSGQVGGKLSCVKIERSAVPSP